MGRIQALLRTADRFQQRHRGLAFGFAVYKKFSDDQAGNLAALIAYYGFLSLFPLMLVAVTVLGILLQHNPSLQHRVLNSALRNFPVIGTQLRKNIHSLNRTGIGLGLGLVGTFYGARGIASAAQNAFNHVWGVPRSHRPGFPFNTLRSFGMIVVVGGGLVATTALSGYGGGATGSLGVGVRIAAFAAALALNVLVFWFGFRMGTAKSVSPRELWLGALVAAVIWQILQGFGTYLVAHELRNASEVYGTFAFVIGLLWWIYLQATATLYAMEIDVVRSRRLWPRSLVQPPLTGPDERAYTAYAKEQQRRDEQRIEVTFDEVS
jgi:membrane protein